MPGYNNSQSNAGNSLASCPQLNNNDYNAWCHSVRLWLNTMSGKERENTAGVVTAIMS